MHFTTTTLAIVAVVCLIVFLFSELTKLHAPGSRPIGLRKLSQCGAVTVTTIGNPSGQNPLKTLFVVQITATADADAAATITHNFGLSTAAQPFTEVMLTLLQSLATTAVANWAINTRGANTVVLQKNTATGSGAAGVQLEARVRVPHTLNL